MGARELETHVKERLGIDYGQTSADGRFTLEPVYCLGNCACALRCESMTAFMLANPAEFDRLLG
jgi:NADH:ubiquinone oxidoreductase subunit E